MYAIDHGASVFIRHLINGQPLLAAAENSPEFDLSQTLALLIARNVITHLNNKVTP